MLNWILCWSLITLPLATILLLASQILNHRRNKKRAVGFFHPYTNDGGGGERVLWCAVKAIQEQNPDLDSVIFSGDDDASSQSLMSRATDRFGVHLLYPPKVTPFLITYPPKQKPIFSLGLIWVFLIVFRLCI